MSMQLLFNLYADTRCKRESGVELTHMQIYLADGSDLGAAGAITVGVEDTEELENNGFKIENYTEKLTYEKLCESDHVELEIAPEKKGLLFTSYREYFVKSRVNRLNNISKKLNLKIITTAFDISV